MNISNDRINGLQLKQKYIYYKEIKELIKSEEFGIKNESINRYIES